MILSSSSLLHSFGYLILLSASSFTAASPIAADVPSSSDAWTPSTSQINITSFATEPYVANGYIGARLPAEGVGLRIHPAIDYDAQNGTQGWPLFTLRQTASIVAGFYDQQDTTKGTNFVRTLFFVSLFLCFLRMAISARSNVRVPWSIDSLSFYFPFVSVLFPSLSISLHFNQDQTGGQQVISLLPTWTSLYLTVSPSQGDGSPATYKVGVPLDHIQTYSQSMSLRNGIVQTTVSWSPFKASNNSTTAAAPDKSDLLQLKYTVLAHRSRPNLGLVRLDVSGLSEGQKVIITDALDGAGAQRVEGEQAGKLDTKELANAIFSSVRPSGIQDTTAWEISTLQLVGGKQTALTAVDVPESVGLGTSQSTVSQSYSMTAPQGGQLAVFKAVGIASSDAFKGTERKTALETAKKAGTDGWDKLVSEHTAAWESLWSEGGEIVIHGAKNLKNKKTVLDDLQETTISSLFHLLANVRHGSEKTGLGDNSIAPAGLTSDSYAGGIFCPSSQITPRASTITGANSWVRLQRTPRSIIERECSIHGCPSATETAQVERSCMAALFFWWVYLASDANVLLSFA